MALGGFVNGQNKEVHFKHLTLEEGLSQSSIFGIEQDTVGFIWLATQDGLNRYDGYGFKVFRNQPDDTNSLAANDIRYLEYDNKGRLWIGTNGGGLDMMETVSEKFTHAFTDVITKTNTESGYITAISIANDGLLWVGTHNGLVRYNPDNGQWKLFKVRGESDVTAKANYIGHIVDINDGNLYLSNNENGLLRFEKATGKISAYNSVNKLIQNQTDALWGQIVVGMSAVGKQIWIGTELGLSSFNPATGKFRMLNPLIEAASNVDLTFANEIYPDPNGGIWVSLLGKGLIKLDTTTWAADRFGSYPQNKFELSHNTLTTLMRDRNGNLWIGTNGRGIDILSSRSKFDNYKVDASDANSLSNNSIRAILRDKKGNTYIGSYGGLSIYYPDGKAKKIIADSRDKTRNLVNQSVYCLLEDADGNIWVGTEGSGIQVYDPVKGVFKYWFDYEEKKYLIDNSVIKLFLSSSNDVWVGTTSGIEKYNKESNSFKEYPCMENGKLVSFHVKDIYEIDPNRFWLGTDRGLAYFDSKTSKYQFFQHEKGNPKSINSNVVLCIKKTRRGDFWIGTGGGGLNKINLAPGAVPTIQDVKHYTTKQGMPSNVVYGILEDTKGNIWMSTNNGICWLDSSEHITTYNIYDGLQSNEFNAGAYYKAGDGTMYFGGINGLNSFNPDKIPFNSQKPKVVITGFKVFNKDRPIASLSDNSIRLNADEDFFSFEFAALDFSIPEKNEYAYKLEGFDEDWVYCGTRHYASYTNLPPGDYVFRVEACNNDHVWNHQGATVNLTITPPFWRNKWFLIFMCTILAVVITIILRVRISRLQEQQKFLEEKVKMQSERLKMEQLKTEIAVSKALIEGQNTEQKRISEDLHDGLGQTLTAANLNLMAIQDNPNMSAKDLERIESMRQLLQNAIVEVRNISHNLMPSLMAEEGLETALTELCNRTIKSSRLDIILKVQDVPNKLGNNVEISLYRIVQEIINNTLKHSGAKSLFISIIYRNHRIFMETEDNGIGFDSGAREYKGLGLKNIGIRVEILNGIYHINSVPGRGTLITIEIPV